MPWTHYIAVMPSASAMNVSWLNAVGAGSGSAAQVAAGVPTGSWQLVQVIPLSPINGNGSGVVMCYFISGSY